MSYKSRVQGAAQEILYCSVKDLNGPATKKVSMAYETYLSLQKEMEIEILSIVQAGKPAAYKDRLASISGKNAKLPSQRGEFPMFKNASQNEKTYLPEDENVIPAPPTQTKERLPDETDKEFMVRRMKEGKAYKEWERKYAEGNEGGGTSESVPESETPRNGPEGEAEAAGADSDGAPGDEATDQVPDPIKEAIERASHEQLEKNA